MTHTLSFRPFQLVFLFLVRVFHGIDVGGWVLSNLETKYFDTKHYSSLTPYFFFFNHLMQEKCIKETGQIATMNAGIKGHPKY